MVKRFPAPGPWITRDLKPCVLASDFDELETLANEVAFTHEDSRKHDAALIALRKWLRAASASDRSAE